MNKFVMYDVPSLEAWRQDYIWRASQDIPLGWYLTHAEGFCIQVKVNEEEATLLKLAHPSAQVFTTNEFYPAGSKETWTLDEKHFPNPTRTIPRQR